MYGTALSTAAGEAHVLVGRRSGRRQRTGVRMSPHRILGRHIRGHQQARSLHRTSARTVQCSPPVVCAHPLMVPLPPKPVLTLSTVTPYLMTAQTISLLPSGVVNTGPVEYRGRLKLFPKCAHRTPIDTDSGVSGRTCAKANIDGTRLTRGHAWPGSSVSRERG